MTLVSAAGKPQDFDELLQFSADKFEAVENKPIVIAYLVGAVFGVFTGTENNTELLDPTPSGSDDPLALADTHPPLPAPPTPPAAEWLIHLPLFNALLGFPIQLLGLVMTPYLAIRYYVDKDGDMFDDAEALVVRRRWAGAGRGLVWRRRLGGRPNLPSGGRRVCNRDIHTTLF